jgi:crotonobetainyl-CoA:carnitine CoA-transferase CaiB-like acyl-CoA transferase
MALNERLVYASFTGYGETGDEAAKPGFDLTAWWARSGLMDIIRTEATAQPARPPTGMGDHPSGISLFAAIVTALYQRERSGKGQRVGSSLMANGLWSNGFQTQAALCGARFTPRPAREQALNALTVYYRCSDDRWLILTILNEDRQWPVLAQCLGREELTRDPRFLKQSDRFANAHALIAILDEAFAEATQAEWRERLAAGGIVFEVVAGADDIVGDKQALANGFCVPFEGSTMLTIDSPFFIADADKVQPRLAPEVGEHSEQILREAGYDAPQIEALRAAKAVA